MFDATTVTAVVGALTGILGSFVAFRSIALQRKQTEIMAAGLERSFEGSESDTGTVVESKLRTVINKRLGENRTKMRQEFGPRLDRIEQTLREYDFKGYESNLKTLIRLLDDQNDIKDIADEARVIRAEVMTAQERVLGETGRYSADIATHGREIETLQQQLEELQSGIRAQIRAIAQHMLQMTGQG